MCLPACTPNVEEHLAISRDASRQLASSLKSTLLNTLQAKGPVEAISVCNIDAKNITKSIFKNPDMQIGRTSLKLRNNQNAPDKWETKQLENFQSQLNNGASFNELEFYEIIKDENGKWFRYMKAIPTSEPCLLCHGEVIAPAIETKIKELYPNDSATGFTVGDIRGAFTVKLAL